MSSFPGAGDVRFSLNGITYQNNSLVTVEDIGENHDALDCISNCYQTCKRNWFFPNGTRVPDENNKSDFYRNREQMVVHLNRRRGGVDGIYRCEIPDSMNATQRIYIGVYTASSGKWHSALLFSSTL